MYSIGIQLKWDQQCGSTSAVMEVTHSWNAEILEKIEKMTHFLKKVWKGDTSVVMEVTHNWSVCVCGGGCILNIIEKNDIK